MRVAMVTGSYPPQPCGVGDYTERLVSELRGVGLRVDVVTTDAAGRSNASGIQYVLKKWTVRNWVRALRWMRSQKYDLLHVQYPARFYGYRPSLGMLSVLAKILLPGTPVVVTLHEFRITHPLRKLTSIGLAAPASALVVTADSERTVVERWMPWLRGRVQVLAMASTIPVLPTSSRRRKELRGSYGIGDSDLVVVYFGLLHPNKGIEKLLKTFALVHQRVPGAKLVMLSLFEPAKNAYHASLESAVAALNVKEAVIWAGYLDNAAVSEHLASADIGFFPFEDGVTLRRLSFMTGMSHGLPIVTTSGHAGTEEIGLRDGENVLLVAAEALAEEVAPRLISLLEDPDKRAGLAKGAREWAAPFQWNAVVQKLLPLYAGIVGRNEKVTHSHG